MTKICGICEAPIMTGERVLIGILADYVYIPSTQTFAIEQPEMQDWVFINHAACEGYLDGRNAED